MMIGRCKSARDGTDTKESVVSLCKLEQTPAAFLSSAAVDYAGKQKGGGGGHVLIASNGGERGGGATPCAPCLARSLCLSSHPALSALSALSLSFASAREDAG